ncbi:elongation factor P, partial [Simkania negevensis]|nr:elongation factor P [Simkania negevensis]
SEFKTGLKVEIDATPYLIVNNQFVKPGKGQAFVRTKLKHLLTGKVIERTFKSGEKIDLADVHETDMRLLYIDTEGVVFMDDSSFEQITVPNNSVEGVKQWLMDDHIYHIIFYKGAPVIVEPPTFMEMKITETDPGLRGDSSGRVLKSAITESGAKIQVPIFIEQDEIVKIDTRTGEYVSRVSK